MSTLATQPARASGQFAIGGDLPVVRLGYGAMQIPGPGVWGEPRDRDEVTRVLRRAVELGVTFIDTADSYGPEVSERLIREALHPYPDDLVIATKAGSPDPLNHKIEEPLVVSIDLEDIKVT
jgi:pyridoxine 4-dehydrogenase